MGGDLLWKHQSILKKEAGRLTDEAKTAEARYVKSPGGSPEAKFQEQMRLSKAMGASELESEAASIGRRFGSKIPIVGWAAAARIGAGVLVGMGADYAWDHWVPDGAKKAINDGLDAVGHTVANAGKAVGHFFSSIF